MLSDRIRARLSELNREALPSTPPSALRTPIAPEPLARDQSNRAASVRDHGELISAFGREVDTALGKHMLIERPLPALWDRADEFIVESQRRLDAVQIGAGHQDWSRFARLFPQKALFLDLETCGFAGSMVFLVGVIHARDGKCVLSQLLARNYAEEQAMLHSLWQIVQGNELLLTFNGKSFDWPMVNDRSVLHRLDAAGNAQAIDHIDLLHHARRRYRKELPNCKLQTLERYLCGRRRAGDIPGSEIPDAYHHYVRTGEMSEMKSILHHNALDLVTLLELSVRLAVHSRGDGP